jgi:hypothetical protein
MSDTKSLKNNAVKSPNVAHWIACSLVAATGVLLTFGALVTTYEATRNPMSHIWALDCIVFQAFCI